MNDQVASYNYPRFDRYIAERSDSRTPGRSSFSDLWRSKPLVMEFGSVT